MKRKRISSTSALLILLISVILANGSVCGIFSPFAVAFCSALTGITSVGIATVGSIVGLLVFGKLVGMLNVVAELLVICGVALCSDTFSWKLSPAKRAVITFATVGVCDLVGVPRLRFEFTDFLLVLSSALFCSFLTFCLCSVLEKRKKRDWIRPDQKQIIFVSILYTALICALSSFELWLFNVGRIAGIITILLFARRSVTEAALCGTLTFSAIALGNLPFAQSSVMLGLGGIIAALLSQYSRLASAMGFLCVNIVGTLALGVNIYSVGGIIDTVLAVTIALLIKYSPEIFSANLSAGDFASQKLLLAADAIAKVEENINRVSGVLDKKTAKNTDWIYEKASGVVCRSCDRNMYCWQDNYDYTARAMSIAVKEFETKTSICVLDLPEYLQKNCKHSDEFASELNGFYSSYLADVRATRKLLSQRKIMLDQLDLAKEMFYKVSEDLSVPKSSKPCFLDIQLRVVSQPANDKISGDSSNSFYDANGNFCFCLFDGMGKGKRASIDSGFLSRVVADLAGTGIDMETVMKTASDCMLVKSNDESFSTADILKINLTSGRTEIIKAGSAPTYYISNGKVVEISTKTFPIGIFSGTHWEKFSVDARAGDIFVLASDGAGEIGEVLEEMNSTNTEVIAQTLVDFARINNEEYKDDVSVVVIKVVKKR